MRKVILTIIGTLLSVALDAFPCNKYVFDFGPQIMPGEIRISWSINRGFNHCGFEGDEILKHRFVIRIESLFGDAILSDTTDQNHFTVNINLTDNSPVMLTIEELGNAHHAMDLLIKPEQEQLPRMHSKIDTLNFFLLNGYLVNAVPLLQRIHKSGLIEEVKRERSILFPEHYPGEQTYFNSYLDSSSMSLVKMPVIDGLAVFLEALNELTKNEPKRTKGFKIYARITDDANLSEYEVIPASDKQTFDKLAHVLTFSKPLLELNHVLIIIGRSKNKRKFTIVNERALMDQRSTRFKTKFHFRGGAVH